MNPIFIKSALGTLFTICSNLLTMMLTKRMILWTIKRAVKYTDNNVDDNVVGILESAYEMDQEKLIEHAENLIIAYKHRDHNELES